MRQGSNGNKINPGFGDVGNAFQRHITGGFRLGAPGDERNTGAHFIEGHVVEQDDIDAERDDFGDLVEAIDFDFEDRFSVRARGRREPPRPGDCRCP